MLIPGTLEDLLAAVESFEEAVRARGGDLMVDEPPRGEAKETSLRLESQRASHGP